MRTRPTLLALAGSLATAAVFTTAIALAPSTQAATGPVDTTAPSVPTGLTVSIDCGNTVTLRWNPSTDDVAVTGYDIYRATGAGFTLLGISTITTATDRINSATQYEIRARDAAGNVSAFSPVATVYPVGCPMPSPSPTPPSTGDTTPPTVPTGLGYRITCSLDVTLQWTASTDNVGVAGYDIYRASSGGTFAPVGTSTTTSFADHLGGVWRYEVRARDFAGNVSAFTAPVTVVPPPCPTMPPSSSPPSTSQSPSTSSSPSTGCTASFSVVSAWTGGFQGQVTVTNAGTTPTTSWTVTLTFPGGQRITQIWNARTNSTASPYAVTNESYNGTLAPGASVAFGFLAASPGTGGPAATTCTRTP